MPSAQRRHSVKRSIPVVQHANRKHAGARARTIAGTRIAFTLLDKQEAPAAQIHRVTIFDRLSQVNCSRCEHHSPHGYKLSTTFILVVFFHSVTTSTLDDGGPSQYGIRFGRRLCVRLANRPLNPIYMGGSRMWLPSSEDSDQNNWKGCYFMGIFPFRLYEKVTSMWPRYTEKLFEVFKQWCFTSIFISKEHLDVDFYLVQVQPSDRASARWISGPRRSPPTPRRGVRQDETGGAAHVASWNKKKPNILNFN